MCFICVLNNQHSCLHSMNSRKKEFTWLLLSNHDSRSLWWWFTLWNPMNKWHIFRGGNDKLEHCIIKWWTQMDTNEYSQCKAQWCKAWLAWWKTQILQRMKMKHINCCTNEHATTNVAKNEDNTKCCKKQKQQMLREMKTHKKMWLKLKTLQKHKAKQILRNENDASF